MAQIFVFGRVMNDLVPKESQSKQSLESSAAMKPVMETIAQNFVCYQYDENIPVSYGSDRWDLYFWCNPFNGSADASERDFSYFTLTFNERQTLEKRRKVCQQVLDLLCSRFQEHPNLDVAVQYSSHFGMGLYSSRILCEKHGGRLILGNQAGGGASATAIFHFV